jgi:D-alanyl-D-alanine endopeptidase (penicillin-binding protein 7)
MKTKLMLLLAAATFAAGSLPGEAVAASKKSVAAKKSPRPASRVKPTRSAKPHRGASIDDAQHLALQSTAALVLDQSTGAVLFQKNPDAVLPIASITKLMTAMVALDAKPDLNEPLAIGDEDVDNLKGTRSRLRVGTQLSREEMLRLALMSSENRAASALSRHYPGGREAFVAAMNQKARDIGLVDTRFEDPTGLNAANVSSPRDLAKLVDEAHRYPLIREFSTTAEGEFSIAGRAQQFRNTNTLVKSPTWEIGLSKTGYISEAGKCLVMQAWFANKPTIIVLLDSWGRLTRIGDANRIKRWIESASLVRPAAG